VVREKGVVGEGPIGQIGQRGHITKSALSGAGKCGFSLKLGLISQKCIFLEKRFIQSSPEAKVRKTLFSF
jgi:hypothetical protein